MVRRRSRLTNATTSILPAISVSLQNDDHRRPLDFGRLCEFRQNNAVARAGSRDPCETSPMMKPCFLPAIAAVFAVTLQGCERVEVVPATPIPEPVAKTRTLETSRLGAAVDSYERNPRGVTLAEVKKALADLDGEIAELEALVAKRSGGERDEAAAKLRNLQAYRAAETARFTVAQAGATVGVPPVGDARSGAQKVEDGAKRVGNTIDDAAKRAGDAIKDAVR